MKAQQDNPSFFRRLTRPFLAGTLALFPIVLTVGVVLWLGSMIHGFIGPESWFGGLLRRFGLAFATSEFLAYLIGLAGVLGLVYFLGILVEAGLKRRWQALVDTVLTKVPLVSTIYDASKKIVKMFEPREKSEMQSMNAVMCSFGGRGGTSFPAFMTTPETIRLNGIDHHVIMIPTAPMPFGGAIMCVPVDWVTPVDTGIDGLFNIYLSMGMTMPEYFNGDKDGSVTE